MQVALADPAVRSAIGAAPTLIAAGKAAAGMIDGLLISTTVQVARGVAVGPDRGAAVPAGMSWLQGGHPLPDAGSVEAGRAALRCAAQSEPSSCVLVLLSGGASALLAAPVDGLTLEEKIDATRILLSAGVPIHELNCVRKHLSDVKGGRLALSARGRVLTLAISDVVGPVEDDPAVIGSGPTVLDRTTYRQALSIAGAPAIRRRMPASVLDVMERGAAGEVPETLKPGHPAAARSTFRLIGSRRQAMAGAASEARRLGYTVTLIEAPVTGEARVAGAEHVTRGLTLRGRPSGPVCVVSSGETTVTVEGNGRGGRNQELALAAAASLDRQAAPVVLASVGTDGVDGPTDAAGALVDSTTLARARALHLGGPHDYLDNNDAYRFFDPLGDLIRTGPSGTNVGDLQILLAGNTTTPPRHD